MYVNSKSLFPYRGKYGSRPPLTFGRTKCHMQNFLGDRILLTDAYDGFVGPSGSPFPSPRSATPTRCQPLRVRFAWTCTPER